MNFTNTNTFQAGPALLAATIEKDKDAASDLFGRQAELSREYSSAPAARPQRFTV